MTSAADRAIIPSSGNVKMGRTRAGTRLAVRPAMGYELAHQRAEILKMYDETKALIGDKAIAPEWFGHTWLICLADEPGNVLKDWFAVQGGHDKESAEKRAMVYVNGRGAELVEIPPYPGEFNQEEWERAWRRHYK